MADTNTVDVPIPVEAGVAPALGDAAIRELAGRLVSRMLQPGSIDRLAEVMNAISDEAKRRGLTDEMLEAELAAYNAERRDADMPPQA
jgi:hypothetical protein